MSKSEREKHYKRPENSNPELPYAHTVPSIRDVKVQKQDEKIEEVRKKSKVGVFLAVTGILAGLAGSAAIVNYALNQASNNSPTKPNSNKKTTSEVPPPVLEYPGYSPSLQEIKGDADLIETLKELNIRATAEDFEYETDRMQLHAKALILNPETQSDKPYSWIPVTQRITRTDQPEILVAVKGINFAVKYELPKYIRPDGLSYRAKTRDIDLSNENDAAISEGDETIMYFYYNCKDKPQPEILAQIGIFNPSNPKELIWAKSFFIPQCEK
jgi:hypothetical protein